MPVPAAAGVEADDRIGRCRLRWCRETCVDCIETMAETIDRRRDVEVVVLQPGHDSSAREVAVELDDCDDVELILHDEQRASLEQDAVTERHALCAEIDLLRHAVEASGEQGS